MNAKVLFVVAVVAALLAVSFVDAKKVAKQEKKGKAKGGKVVEKAKVEKREVKAPKVEKVVVEKIVEKVVEVEKPAKQEKSLKHVEVIEEEVVEEEPEAPTHVAAPATPERPHVVKPKHLKIMTAYEECKLQCKKQRDQEDAQQYVQRLRDELAHAESLIAEQEAANAAAQDVQEEAGAAEVVSAADSQTR